LGCSYLRVNHQDNLFALLQAESESIKWKSYVWDFPGGVLKFALNASMDIGQIAHLHQSKKVGKHASVNCHLFENTVKQMLFYFPVHCGHTMDQRRMTILR
jgi:hypothetical protein